MSVDEEDIINGNDSDLSNSDEPLENFDSLMPPDSVQGYSFRNNTRSQTYRKSSSRSVLIRVNSVKVPNPAVCYLFGNRLFLICKFICDFEFCR